MMRWGVLKSSVVAVALGMSALAASAYDDTEIKNRIGKLEQAMNNRGLLDLLQEVEALKRDIQRLQGQIEDQSHAIELVRKGQKDSYVDLDRRVRALEAGGAAAGTAAAAAPGAPLPTIEAPAGDSVAGTPAPESSLQMEMQNPPPAAPAPAEQDPRFQGGPRPGEMTVAPSAAQQPPVDAGATPVPPAAENPQLAAAAPPAVAAATADDAASEAAYKDAFSMLKTGDYDHALTAFSNFRQQYPASQYGDNAQWWIGEIHYAKGRFQPAVGEYQNLIRNFPASKKLPQALLKIGYGYEKLGQVDQARAVLEDLKRRYPGTQAAHLAEEKLATLNAAAKKKT
ncbi:MAG: tol-pal system protein YbgF [Gammaproteobacteria bacterium]|nr:tol-pal system protein YbgF [Gammaproteobacteria bacterium]MBI5617153.1 tol-pal system protein YbgF [Gammaproteobacteria bacterium]